MPNKQDLLSIVRVVRDLTKVKYTLIIFEGYFLEVYGTCGYEPALLVLNPHISKDELQVVGKRTGYCYGEIALNELVS